MQDPLSPVSTSNPAGYRDVTVTAAAPLVGRVPIVDVREPDEFVGPLGHIAGAQLVPLGSVGGSASRWAPDAPLLLVCRSGGRSGRAASMLARAGFSRVYNLAGGMLAWADASLPVDRA